MDGLTLLPGTRRLPEIFIDVDIQGPVSWNVSTRLPVINACTVRTPEALLDALAGLWLDNTHVEEPRLDVRGLLQHDNVPACPLCGRDLPAPVVKKQA